MTVMFCVQFNNYKTYNLQNRILNVFFNVNRNKQDY